MHGVACHRMRLLHEFGNSVDARPGTDFAVVGFTVVGEHRTEQRPVPAIDAGRITQQDIGDVSTVVKVAHFTSPFRSTTIHARGRSTFGPNRMHAPGMNVSASALPSCQFFSAFGGSIALTDYSTWPYSPNLIARLNTRYTN